MDIEKLRAELEQARESLDFARTKDAEIVRLGRELEQVKRELQAYKDTGLEPEDFKRAFHEDAVLKLAGQALGIAPDRLRELAQADREGLCVILPKEEPLKKGMTIWYVDTDTGEIEEGEVFSTDYKDGRLDSFSVDFKFSGDFDAFFGSAWGSCFFGSREQAEAALRREQDGQDD